MIDKEDIFLTYCYSHQTNHLIILDKLILAHILLANPEKLPVWLSFFLRLYIINKDEYLSSDTELVLIL